MARFLISPRRKLLVCDRSQLCSRFLQTLDCPVDATFRKASRPVSWIAWRLALLRCHVCIAKMPTRFGCVVQDVDSLGFQPRCLREQDAHLTL